MYNLMLQLITIFQIFLLSNKCFILSLQASWFPCVKNKHSGTTTFVETVWNWTNQTAGKKKEIIKLVIQFPLSRFSNSQSFLSAHCTPDREITKKKWKSIQAR